MKIRIYEVHTHDEQVPQAFENNPKAAAMFCAGEAPDDITLEYSHTIKAVLLNDDGTETDKVVYFGSEVNHPRD